MRGKVVIVALALLTGVTAGCKQQCIPSACDNRVQDPCLPPDLECNPRAGVVPAGADVPEPATVQHPERQPRYLTLQEAIAMALEHGFAGSPAFGGLATSPALSEDPLGAFTGRGVTQSD